MRTPPAMDQPPHLKAGRDAEDRACAYLSERGLQLLQRNYRCRSGEIDLIMRDGATLVFVEVRFRADSRFGHGADTVDRRKQLRLIGAAQTYLQHTRDGSPCRFDVVAITGHQLQWLADAFQV